MDERKYRKTATLLDKRIKDVRKQHKNKNSVNIVV